MSGEKKFPFLCVNKSMDGCLQIAMESERIYLFGWQLPNLFSCVSYRDDTILFIVSENVSFNVYSHKAR